MTNNYMITNPSKFHAILLTKSPSNTVGKTLKLKIISCKVNWRLSYWDWQLITDCLSTSILVLYAKRQPNSLKHSKDWEVFKILLNETYLHHHLSWQTSTIVQPYGISVVQKTSEKWKSSGMYTSICLQLIIHLLIANYYARPNLVYWS